MAEWINVKDELPKPYEPILMCHHRHRGKGFEIDAGIYTGGKEWRVGAGYTFTSVTHWMPYPELPEEVRRHG